SKRQFLPSDSRLLSPLLRLSAGSLSIVQQRLDAKWSVRQRVDIQLRHSNHCGGSARHARCRSRRVSKRIPSGRSGRERSSFGYYQNRRREKKGRREVHGDPQGERGSFLQRFQKEIGERSSFL